MNTNHTPAPWAYAPSHPAKANDAEHVIEMEGGSSPIAIVYSGGVGISHSQAQSNARLIAAAPELQTMLIRLLGEVMMDEAVFSKIAPLTLEQARMAIAKSKGEQPCATN
jgi:hypothetical protein